MGTERNDGWLQGVWTWDKNCTEHTNGDCKSFDRPWLMTYRQKVTLWLTVVKASNVYSKITIGIFLVHMLSMQSYFTHSVSCRTIMWCTRTRAWSRYGCIFNYRRKQHNPEKWCHAKKCLHVFNELVRLKECAVSSKRLKPVGTPSTQCFKAFWRKI